MGFKAYWDTQIPLLEPTYGAAEMSELNVVAQMSFVAGKKEGEVKREACIKRAVEDALWNNSHMDSGDVFDIIRKILKIK